MTIFRKNLKILGKIFRINKNVNKIFLEQFAQKLLILKEIGNNFIKHPGNMTENFLKI